MVYIVFLVGTAVGSFTCVCVHRLLHDESIIYPPSRADCCGIRLSWQEMLPIVSWVWQRGRCRYCGAKITWMYPLAELFMGLSGSLVYSCQGLKAFMASQLLLFFLLLLSIIDCKEQVVFDEVLTTMAAAALLLHGTDGFPAEFSLSFIERMLGMTVSFVPMYLLAVSSGGLGGGDVKLAAVLGLWFGWQNTYLIIFLAFLGGGIIGAALLLSGQSGARDKVPFVPFLAAATVCCCLWGRPLLEWYGRLLW